MTESTTARLAPGQRRRVRISSLGQGDGAVAQIDGDRRPLRVAGGVPGDLLEVAVRRVGQHAAWASLVEVVEPSPQRVPAPCKVLLECGGCPWMAASAELQRDQRLQAVRQALKPALDKQAEADRSGADSTTQIHWQLWPGHSAAESYRTRAMVMLAGNALSLRWGLFSPGSQRLIATSRCLVHHPEIDRALQAVVGVLGAQGLTAWNRRSERGDVAAIALRLDPQTGGLGLTLVAQSVECVQPVVRELLAIEGIGSVWVNLPPPGQQAVMGRKTEQLAGSLRQKLHWQGPDGPLTLEIGPSAFVQTRHDMAETLLAEVASSLPLRMEHLLDLYGGIGIMGLSLAGRTARLTLAEREAEANLDARYNVGLLQHAGTLRAETQVRDGDALQVVADLAQEGVDAAVLDPPRAGCGDAVLDALTGLPQLRHLALVSCGLAGLQRDIQGLVARGWAVQRVAVLEMFPHAPHAEVVVGLSRVGPN